MANYKLTNKAIEDLSDIWNYTFEMWSENQADKYYDSLISVCREIANNPDLGKIYVEISDKLLGLKVNRHVIFYRTVSKNYVEITRILHERMDLKHRVSE
jgi:toxin ParE1/3/4